MNTEVYNLIASARAADARGQVRLAVSELANALELLAHMTVGVPDVTTTNVATTADWEGVTGVGKVWENPPAIDDEEVTPDPVGDIVEYKTAMEASGDLKDEEEPAVEAATEVTDAVETEEEPADNPDAEISGTPEEPDAVTDEKSVDVIVKAEEARKADTASDEAAPKKAGGRPKKAA